MGKGELVVFVLENIVFIALYAGAFLCLPPMTLANSLILFAVFAAFSIFLWRGSRWQLAVNILILALITVSYSVFILSVNPYPTVPRFSDKELNERIELSGEASLVHYKFEKSEKDKDGDDIENREDLYQSAREYTGTHPIYKDRTYEGGYPDDNYGIDTDVVTMAFQGAGFDLKELVQKDFEEGGYMEEDYDPSYDFRRIDVLYTFFRHMCVDDAKDCRCFSLTVNPYKTDQWQAGDIVFWENHVGIVSDIRNARGIPFVIHHRDRWQASFEEDVLTEYGDIKAHFRKE